MRMHATAYPCVSLGACLHMRLRQISPGLRFHYIIRPANAVLRDAASRSKAAGADERQLFVTRAVLQTLAVGPSGRDNAAVEARHQKVRSLSTAKGLSLVTDCAVRAALMLRPGVRAAFVWPHTGARF